MRVYDVIRAVSFGGTMRSAMSVLLEKPAFLLQRMPAACEPKHCPFSRTSNGCQSTFCDIRCPECSQSCGIGRREILNELCLHLVLLKEV